MQKLNLGKPSTPAFISFAHGDRPYLQGFRATAVEMLRNGGAGANIVLGGTHELHTAGYSADIFAKAIAAVEQPEIFEPGMFKVGIITFPLRAVVAYQQTQPGLKVYLPTHFVLITNPTAVENFVATMTTTYGPEYQVKRDGEEV